MNVIGNQSVTDTSLYERHDLHHDYCSVGQIDSEETRLVGWLVVLRIYVALAIFQPYRDLKAGDKQYLKS